MLSIWFQRYQPLVWPLEFIYRRLCARKRWPKASCRGAPMAFHVAKVPYLQFDLHQLSNNWHEIIEFNHVLPQKQVYRIRCGGTSFLAAL